MTLICSGWIPGHPHPTPIALTDGIEDGQISHGICPSCRAYLDAQIETAAALIDAGRLDAPKPEEKK